MFNEFDSRLGRIPLILLMFRVIAGQPIPLRCRSFCNDELWKYWSPRIERNNFFASSLTMESTIPLGFRMSVMSSTSRLCARPQRCRGPAQSGQAGSWRISRRPICLCRGRESAGTKRDEGCRVRLGPRLPWPLALTQTTRRAQERFRRLTVLFSSNCKRCSPIAVECVVTRRCDGDRSSRTAIFAGDAIVSRGLPYPCRERTRTELPNGDCILW